MKIVAIILFVAMYVLMIAKPRYRYITALVTALIYIICGILPVSEILPSIDFNVLLMILGTMMIVSYFIDSKMPSLIADKILDLAPNVCWVTILMSLFAGVVSAFIDNVATLLIVAPIAIEICKKLRINPVPMVISIAVSSNLQGAATLVGDTTSIMLGAYAGMDFTDFFVMDGKPGMFWVVEAGAAATIPIMLFMFRKEKQPVSAKEKTTVEDYVPTFLMLAMVLSLIIASFIPNKPSVTNGVICCVIGGITMLVEWLMHHDMDALERCGASLDIQLVLLLSGLFMVIGGIKNVGVIDDLAALIAKAGENNLFLLYTIVVWGSVAISAFIDNIPYVATMLPVLQGVTKVMGISPYLLYFGLLSGATLGGNITPIGASCNIAAVSLLRKEGKEVSFPDFMKIGVPFTLAAVLVAYVLIWMIWA
jgi:Na+/H+ antiporter NhaD/arsenite permease-like protein